MQQLHRSLAILLGPWTPLVNLISSHAPSMSQEEEVASTGNSYLIQFIKSAPTVPWLPKSRASEECRSSL